MGVPAGFNSGFAKGLASVLGQQRVTDQQTERDAVDRQNRLQDILLRTALENADSPDQAIAFMQTQFPGMFKGANGKVVSTILGRGLPQAASQALGGGGQAPAVPQAQRPALSAGGAPPVGPVASADLGMPATLDPPVPGGVPLIGALGSLQRPLPQAPTTPPAVVQAVQAQAAPATAAGTPALDPLSKTAALLRITDAALLSRQRIIDHLKSAGLPLDEQETQYLLANGQLSRPYGSGAGLGMRSIAGELADGSPAFGVFSPITGTYTDPATGTPLDGFRPRTSTGSRTLGGTREALAMEMFGKQASQLTAEQMGQVNARLPEYERVVANARGLGSGEARNETALDKPFTVDENAQLQTPQGTTTRQILGQTPMTPKQQETRQALTSLQAKLPRLQQLVAEVIPNYGEGIVARARSAGELRYKSLAGDPKFTALKAMAKSMTGEISRALQGQTGVLSDQDTQRANDLIVNVDSYFPDTGPMAVEKINVIIELMAAINAAIPHPQVTGAGAGAGASVPPAPAPASPSPTRTPVTNAAPAAKKVGNAWVIP